MPQAHVLNLPSGRVPIISLPIPLALPSGKWMFYWGLPTKGIPVQHHRAEASHVNRNWGSDSPGRRREDQMWTSTQSQCSTLFVHLAGEEGVGEVRVPQDHTKLGTLCLPFITGNKRILFYNTYAFYSLSVKYAWTSAVSISYVSLAMLLPLSEPLFRPWSHRASQGA